MHIAVGPCDVSQPEEVIDNSSGEEEPGAATQHLPSRAALARWAARNAVGRAESSAARVPEDLRVEVPQPTAADAVGFLDTAGLAADVGHFD
eukprot:7138286-Alexandrium_andersonii.AAC.1